jgi:hypothetical protein
VPIHNSAPQAELLSKVLKLNCAKYKTLWTKKSFREVLNATAVKAGDPEGLGAVKSTPDAVGYVGSPPAGSRSSRSIEPRPRSHRPRPQNTALHDRLSDKAARSSSSKAIRRRVGISSHAMQIFLILR